MVLADCNDGKGDEQQTAMQSGKRRPCIFFFKRKDYGMIGEYTKGFDKSKFWLKSLRSIDRLKQYL